MDQSNEEAKEQIIKDFLPIVEIAAYRLAFRLPHHLTVDDLVSAGLMGLMDAFDKYVPGKAKFKTYAEFRIKGAMLDDLRNQAWIPRSMKKKLSTIDSAIIKLKNELGRTPDEDEIVGETGMTIDKYHKIVRHVNFDMISIESLSNSANKSGCLNVLDSIRDPDAEDPFNVIAQRDTKKILTGLIDKLSKKEKQVILLYYDGELSMKETGVLMDITEARVCQLHKKALTKLKAMTNQLPDQPLHIFKTKVF